MKKQIIHLLLVLGIVITGGIQYGLFAQLTYESAQSGNFSVGSTWVGGQAPPDYQHILIKSGHNVTLDRGTDWNDYILVWDVTIEEGAVLSNNGWPLWIRTPSTSTPQYKNDGTHNGPGTLQAYENGDMRIDGNGSTNLDIEYHLQGALQVRWSSNLTINGDIKPTQYGYAGPAASIPRIKYEIFNGVGGSLTVNGDVYSAGNIVSNNPVYVTIPAEGTLIVNGNIYFNANADQITNFGTFTVSGNLTLGLTSSSYFWNRNQGNAEIGGDVIGSGNCFLRHGHDAVIRFGGQVFPNGVGSLQFIQPSILNVVEFNGHLQQTVKPFNLPFQNLIINNSSPEGVELSDHITVNTSLGLQNGHLHLNDKNLTLAAAATITGAPSASSMVVASGSGEFRKKFNSAGAFTFPVGKAGYSPVTVEFNTGTFNPNAEVGVRVINESYPGAGANHVARYWSISSTGITGYMADLTFSYNASDVVGNEGQIYCFRVEPNEEMFAPANTVLHTLTAANVTEFGTFTGKTPPNLNVPTAFNVTGGGEYCEGAPGIEVGLDNSEADAFYTLFRNAIPIIHSVQGTGSAFSFGIQKQGLYTIEGTNSVGTTLMNGSAEITEIPLLAVGVSITADQNNVCIGTTVTFTATPVNGGSPDFQWLVNDVIAGGNQDFFSYIPSNGDEVMVSMTSSLECVTNSPATSNTIVMQVTGSCQPWEWTVTGQAHTIVIPEDAVPEIYGIPVLAGDWIGVFYEDEFGVEKCGGAVQWNPSGIALLAYGNDPLTPEKEGFAAGEKLRWRLFDANTSTEYPAKATYDVTMPHQGNFADFGLSKLTMLQVTFCHEIQFQTGWNSLSTYLVPSPIAVEQLMAPMQNELIIMRNLTQIYWPDFNINTIGNYNNNTGYVVKVTENVDFGICGNSLAGNSLNLSPGWRYMPVLSECEVSAMSLFGSSINDIIIVQELIGTKVFWPAMNVYTLEYLQPGKAYKIKTSAAISLTFPECGSKTGFMGVKTENKITSPWGETAMTPATQMVVFTQSASELFTVGDIIGAFGADDHPYGVAVVDSKNQNHAITLFGDDQTGGLSNGFTESEPISYKLYRASTGEEFDLEVEYDHTMNATGNFHSGSFAAIVNVSMNLTGVDEIKQSLFSMYPNPANDFVHFRFNGSDSDEVYATIIDAKGQIVADMHFSGSTQINISSLDAGVYFVKISTQTHTEFRKLIKQ